MFCITSQRHDLSLISYLLFVLVAPALLAGCASTGGSVDIVKKLDAHDCVTSTDTVQVTVQPASGVSMGSLDMQRLSELIKSKVDQKKVNNPSSGQPRKFNIDVTITRYEKGSAAARAMAAGLGQIHIDG